MTRWVRTILDLPPVGRATRVAVGHSELPKIARIVIVAAAGWQVCVWLGASYPPIYSVLVPLVSLKSDPFSAFNLSWAGSSG